MSEKVDEALEALAVALEEDVQITDAVGIIEYILERLSESTKNSCRCDGYAEGYRWVVDDESKGVDSKIVNAFKTFSALNDTDKAYYFEGLRAGVRQAVTDGKKGVGACGWKGERPKSQEEPDEVKGFRDGYRFVVTDETPPTSVDSKAHDASVRAGIRRALPNLKYPPNGHKFRCGVIFID